jgi:putative transposase
MAVPVPHRKRVKRFHEPGDVHELTFSCYRRWPLLKSNSWRRALSRCIDKAAERWQLRLVAFVFMPEHVHLIVYPGSPCEAAISQFLKSVKQPFSRYVKADLVARQHPLFRKLSIRDRPGHTSFRFWQEGPGFDRNLGSPQATLAAIDYVHRNPTRRGLADHAAD